MNTNTSIRKSLLIFFLLVFIIAIPFWLIGTVTEQKEIPINLPISAFAAFCPLIAALILVYRENGPLIVPIYFVIFFIAAIGEEMGWTGYAIDPLQDWWRNALLASIFLGAMWAVWHLVPFIQTHNTPIWVAGQDVHTVVLRVLIVWLYNNTGKSVFAAITFHAMANVSELVLFPIYGSYYDPVIASIIMAITAVIVTFLWGSKTLARYRYA